MTDATPGATAPSVTASAPAGTEATVTPAAGAAPAAGASPSAAAPAAPAAAAPAAEPAKPAAEPAKPAAAEPKKSLLEASGTKPAEAAKPATEAKPGEAPSTEAAKPAPYDFALPEGVKITDEKQFGEFKTLLSTQKVPVEAAPELTKFLAGEKEKLVASQDKYQRDVWDDTNAKWEEAVRTDPKIGGDKLESTLGQISSMMNEFGKDIPSLRATMTLTGAGNHPDIVKFLHNISEVLVKEGGMVAPGKNVASKPKSRAERMYSSNS